MLFQQIQQNEWPHKNFAQSGWFQALVIIPEERSDSRFISICELFSINVSKGNFPVLRIPLIYRLFTIFPHKTEKFHFAVTFKSSTIY